MEIHVYAEMVYRRVVDNVRMTTMLLTRHSHRDESDAKPRMAVLHRCNTAIRGRTWFSCYGYD